jgi:hypothetical protein
VGSEEVEMMEMMNPETLAGMHETEILRAIERLRAARREAKLDIELLEAELDRRARRQAERQR